MKNIKKSVFLALSFIMIFSLISGCSSKSTDNATPTESGYDNVAREEMGMSPYSEDIETESMVDDSTSSPLDPTKVIVTLYIDMQTIEFDNSISAIDNLISKYESYVEDSTIELGSYYSQNIHRYASYTIRVPKDKVNAFMNETGSIGKITHQNESKEDVTMHYRDTESRLNVLEIKEERIISLLKKAEKMEDIITLENSLSDIIYEKESLMGVLKNLDHRVDFTTITINLQEVQKLSNTEDNKTSFGQRIINAISDSLYYFKIGTENFIIQLIYALPVIIILALLAFAIYRGIRFYNSKKESHKNMKIDDTHK